MLLTRAGLRAVAPLVCPLLLQAQPASAFDSPRFASDQSAQVISAAAARHPQSVGMRRSTTAPLKSPPISQPVATDGDGNEVAVGLVIGAAVGGIVSYARCKKVGCTSYVSIAIVTAAGGTLGAAIGWIVHRLSMPLPQASPTPPAQTDTTGLAPQLR